MTLSQTEKTLIERLAESGADKELTVLISANLTEAQQKRMIGFLEYMMENQDDIEGADILEVFMICRKNLKPKNQK